MFSLSFFEPPKVPRENEGRSAIRLEFLKGFVTRDEAITISGNGCANDWIVIRIRTAGIPQLGWLHKDATTPQQSKDFSAFGHAETELFRKHILQFIEDIIGQDDDVLKGDVFE